MKIYYILITALLINIYPSSTISNTLEDQTEIIDRLIQRRHVRELTGLRAFIKESFTVESVPYILSKLNDKNLDLEKSILFVLLGEIAHLNQDAVKKFDLDNVFIDFIESTENSYTIDDNVEFHIIRAINALGQFPSEQASDYLVERAGYDYWKEKVHTFENTGDLNSIKYRRHMRDVAINALSKNQDDKSETFLNQLEIHENDPDASVILPNISRRLNQIRIKKGLEVAKKNNDETLKNIYKDLEKLMISLEAYRIDHGRYPESLQLLVRPKNLCIA